ncbi:MAG: hypothetical protein AMJ75_07245 [Phycisphaerae bacterium SM1_79]|nr:MAG: hypothetical protein AMJ75_07245 [Phycisphaerae bacterium SM1_79]
MDDKLVTIAQFTDYIEAEMAKQLLADHEIEAVVSGDNTANVYSIPAVAEIDLQVLESQAKEAVEILESRKTQEQ